MFIKDSGMARIKNSNGSENVITWRPAPGGIRVNNDFTGTSGYYQASKSFTVIRTREWLEKELESAQELGLTVNLH